MGNCWSPPGTTGTGSGWRRRSPGCAARLRSQSSPGPDSPPSQADAAVWPTVAVVELPGLVGYRNRGYGELGAVGEVEGECAECVDRVAVGVAFDCVVSIDGDACDRPLTQVDYGCERGSAGLRVKVVDRAVRAAQHERREDNQVGVDADGPVVLLVEQLKGGLVVEFDLEDPRADEACGHLHYEASPWPIGSGVDNNKGVKSGLARPVPRDQAGRVINLSPITLPEVGTPAWRWKTRSLLARAPKKTGGAAGHRMVPCDAWNLAEHVTR